MRNYAVVLHAFLVFAASALAAPPEIHSRPKNRLGPVGSTPFKPPRSKAQNELRLFGVDIISTPSVEPQAQLQGEFPPSTPSVEPQAQSQAEFPPSTPSVEPQVQSQAEFPPSTPSVEPQPQAQLQGESLRELEENKEFLLMVENHIILITRILREIAATFAFCLENGKPETILERENDGKAVPHLPLVVESSVLMEWQIQTEGGRESHYSEDALKVLFETIRSHLCTELLKTAAIARFKLDSLGFDVPAIPDSYSLLVTSQPGLGKPDYKEVVWSVINWLLALETSVTTAFNNDFKGDCTRNEVIDLFMRRWSPGLTILHVTLNNLIYTALFKNGNVINECRKLLAQH